MEHFILLSDEDKKTLIMLANKSIDYGLVHSQVMPIKLDQYSKPLQENGASFVTLEIQSMLRGCIGALQAYQPLAKDVVEHAFSAAFKDPRFSPLQKEERPQLSIKLSILNLATPLQVASEEDLLSQLRPNIDGLILIAGDRRATFLPSVWSSLSDKRQFLQHLKLKAGLSADHWSNEMRFFRYTVEEVK